MAWGLSNVQLRQLYISDTHRGHLFYTAKDGDGRSRVREIECIRGSITGGIHQAERIKPFYALSIFATVYFLAFLGSCLSTLCRITKVLVYKKLHESSAIRLRSRLLGLEGNQSSGEFGGPQLCRYALPIVIVIMNTDKSLRGTPTIEELDSDDAL